MFLLFHRSRSRGVGYSLLLVASLTGCGYTPQSTLDALDKIGPNTPPEDMKIMVALPPGILPQKGDVTLTLSKPASKTLRAESHSFRLEHIPNGPDEIRTGQSANGFAYRIDRKDLPRFKALVSKEDVSDNRDGDTDIDADFCHISPEIPKHAVITVYLKTAELQNYVPLVKDMDVMKYLDPAERADFPRCTAENALIP